MDGPQRPLAVPTLSLSFSLPLICHIFWLGLFDIIIASIIGPFPHEWDGMGKRKRERGDWVSVEQSLYHHAGQAGFVTLAYVAGKPSVLIIRRNSRNLHKQAWKKWREFSLSSFFLAITFWLRAALPFAIFVVPPFLHKRRIAPQSAICMQWTAAFNCISFSVFSLPIVFRYHR